MKRILAGLLIFTMTVVTFTGCDKNKTTNGETVKKLTLYDIYNSQPDTTYHGIISANLDAGITYRNVKTGNETEFKLDSTGQIDIANDIANIAYTYSNQTSAVKQKKIKDFWYTTNATYVYDEEDNLWSLEYSEGIQVYKQFFSNCKKLVEYVQDSIDMGESTFVLKDDVYELNTFLKLEDMAENIYCEYQDEIQNKSGISLNMQKNTETEDAKTEEAENYEDETAKKPVVADYGKMYVDMTFDKETCFLKTINITFDEVFYKAFHEFCISKINFKVTMEYQDEAVLELPEDVMKNVKQESEENMETTINVHADVSRN